MKFFRQQFTVWLALIAASTILCTTGCYPDWPGHAGTANVEGEFTLDGLPHADAKVIFVPVRLRTDSGKLRAIAYGVCDANGRFKLAYSDGSGDIVAGRYNVICSWIDKDKSTAPLERFVLPDASDQVLADQLTAMIDKDQEVPSFYNRESELYYDLEPSPAIVRYEIKLTSVDPLVNEAK